MTKGKCRWHKSCFLLQMAGAHWSKSKGFNKAALFKLQILYELKEASMRKCAWYIVIVGSLCLLAFSSVEVQSEHSQVHMLVLKLLLIVKNVEIYFSAQRVVETFFAESAHNSERRIVVEWWGRPLGSFHVDHGGICLAPTCVYQPYPYCSSQKYCSFQVDHGGTWLVLHLQL